MCREPLAVRKSDNFYIGAFFLMLFGLLGGALYNVWLKCCDLFEVIINAFQ